MKIDNDGEWNTSRRNFLSLTCGAIISAMPPVNIASALDKKQSSLEFIESTYDKGANMKKKILIAYASRCGSTGGVADTVGQVLHASGASVDVRLLKKVKDISPYQAIIVGSAIRMGKWLPEAADFVKKHKEALSKLPVAFFVVCLTMKDDTPENRNTVLNYLKPVHQEAPQVIPVDTGLFAGAVDFKKLSFVYRIVLKSMDIVEGDYRNWEAVKNWAGEVSRKII